MVEVLNALSTRPPTPPRTSDLIVSTQSSDRSEETTQYFQTPRDSPASRRGSTGIPSTRGSKRVNFSPWTRYIKPPTFGNSTVRVTAELKGPLPSNECKPVKSILKPTQSPAPFRSPDIESYKPESFAMLLESATQQLAGDSASSHVDAYMHLLGALRAYDGIPGPEELAQKIGSVTQFLQRDINMDVEIGGPLETNIVIQALKLSIAFIWHPTISQSGGLSDDFKIYLVERAIDRLQAVKTPKSIVTHCMHILVTQNFNPKIMTNARVARLLTTLHDLTSRVNGNAIVSQRLSIYQRLLDQSRATFVNNASLWMEHLISGLLHPLKDTRLKAIALGFQTSTSVGPNPTLSRNVKDVFDRPLDKGTKLVKEICERMSRMMANTDSGVHIPQIWSIIVLLLRNKKASIEKWDCFKEWALVLQKCFNCSESAIKAQAILAWNRFVFVVGPSESTTSSMIKMLGKPVLSQFERKRNDKIGTQPSQLALTSYYNLLYYAFRPAASHQQCDLVWEEYMAAPSSTIFSSSPQLCDRVSQALSSLLWSSQAKFWSENRVNESTKLEPEELPSLDCKWVRSRVGSVLRVFEHLLRASTWDDDHIEISNIALAWLGLSKALASASSKEITPTTESMQAVAHLLGLLQRLWNTGPSSLNAHGGGANDKFVKRYRFLSTTMILSVGSGPFTDKLLLRTAAETFQLANTPTHRHSRTSSLDNPISHLLRIISGPSEAVVQCESYPRLINDTLQAACSGKVSRASRLEFLGQCADLNAKSSESIPAEERSRSLIWQSTANLAADCLRSFPGESARERDGTVSRDYEVVRHILSIALELTDVGHEWDVLLESFVRVVRTERGDGALAAIVVEPVAKSLLTATLCDDTYGFLGALINRSLSIPFQSQASQSSQTSAPRMSLDAATRPDSGNLVQLIHRALQASYAQFEPSRTRCFVEFIESLTSFLGSGALTFRSTILENLQQPLSTWLGDEEHKADVDRGVESRVLTAYRALASSAINILQSLESHDATCLGRYESLICSGLTSTHVSVSKRFVKSWKATFGLQESLEYSERIRRALQTVGILNGQDQLDTSSTSDLQVGRWKVATKRDIAGHEVADSVDLPATLGFNSSPVVKAEDVHIPAQLNHSHARALDNRHLAGTKEADTPCIGVSTEVANAEVPVGVTVPNKADMFTVIADIRSSSPPTSTPRNLDFRTPPQLRSLQDEDRQPGTPLTPTFAAVNVENEEPFFGSSPTPSTRHGQTATNTPPSLPVTGRKCAVVDDPPSSPPEFRPRQRKERKRSTSRASTLQREISYLTKMSSGNSVRMTNEADLKTGLVGDVASGVIESCPESFANDSLSLDEQLPVPKRRRSLRSANSRSNSAPSTPNTHRNAMNLSRFDDVANKDESRNQRAVKPTATKDAAPIHDEPENSADSSSDDMEMQIASQLEQDMVLAGNAEEHSGDQEPAQFSHSYPLTRKRKREFSETPMTPEHPRPRSSRSAPVQDLTAEDVSEARTTRSGRLLGSQPLANVRDPELTPSRSANKKRKMQKTVDVAAVATTAEEQDEIPIESDSHKPLENPEPSPEKRRRSPRLGGQAALPPADESPGRKDSGSESRTRRRGTSDHELELDEPLNEVGETQEVVASDTNSGQTDAAVEEAIEGADVSWTGSSHQDLIEAAVESQLGAPDDAQQSQPADGQQPKADVPMHDAEPVVADGHSTVEAMQGTIARAVQTDNSQDVPTEEDEVTETAIVDSLRKVLENVKKSSLSRSTLREVDDLLFEIRMETHEANRRHGL